MSDDGIGKPRKSRPERSLDGTTRGGIYGGSVFNLLLWGYWFAAATSLFLAMFHIMRGEIQRHRAWITMDYGLVLGAPLLRVCWMFYGCFESPVTFMRG